MFTVVSKLPCYPAQRTAVLVHTRHCYSKKPQKRRLCQNFHVNTDKSFLAPRQPFRSYQYETQYGSRTTKNKMSDESTMFKCCCFFKAIVQYPGDFVFSTTSSSVSRYFKPCQPQRIIPGLRVTFIKKAEIRPKEQSEKAGSC